MATPVSAPPPWAPLGAGHSPPETGHKWVHQHFSRYQNNCYHQSLAKSGYRNCTCYHALWSPPTPVAKSRYHLCCKYGKLPKPGNWKLTLPWVQTISFATMQNKYNFTSQENNGVKYWLSIIVWNLIMTVNAILVLSPCYSAAMELHPTIVFCTYVSAILVLSKCYRRVMELFQEC